LLNFDSELLVLLQDIRYLERNLGGQVLAIAKEIYHNTRVYSEYIHMLQVLIERYDDRLSAIVEVQRPMFQRHIDHVDAELEDGISMLTWESEWSGEFLQRAVQEVMMFSELHNK
jgi:hypothetical protein